MKKFSVFCCLLFVLFGVEGRALVGAITNEEETSENHMNESLNEGIEKHEEQLIEGEIDLVPEIQPTEELPSKNTRDVYDDVNAEGVAKKNSKTLIENALNSSYKKEKLGYQLGSIVSWILSAELTHIGSDMLGDATNLKYTGNTTVSEKISTLLADGTIRLEVNPSTKVASLTRVKNKISVLESGSGLSYSYSASYSYSTWKYVVWWNRVEDRFGTINAVAKLSNIALELPPNLIVDAINPLTELEQDSSVTDLPEDYVMVSQQMVGGSLSYEWSVKPDTSKVGAQTAKVKVTNTLGDYKNTIEVMVPIMIIEKGHLSIEVPENLEFKDYQISNTDTIIERKNTDWGVVIEDSRHNSNKEKEGWNLTAKARTSESGLENYLVFIDEEGTEHSLLEAAPIFTRLEHIENTVIKWPKNKGMLLKIPKKNDLRPNKQYQTTIIWNVNEGP
ncbi:exported hypothetical protein [Carnobacterium maltaromaticum]|uniref:WxL domain-containing protein n=1 Tax=Carnobacterium maltaromaticum TaxID=2751 RepID=A0AAW9JSQ7_CARML|nr:hypothetical protein [Carnobacterium maltaromaticum]MDZ5759562.1 hypothetical protein [Carnobacterium maltaromaticum]CAD5897489.1 exported hypothetical protein [Carnobacterium maltaromaticum]